MTLHRLGHTFEDIHQSSILVTKPDGTTTVVLGHLRESMKAIDLDRIVLAAGKKLRDDEALSAFGYRPKGMETR